MSENTEKLYKDNSQPLQEVKIEELKEREVFINSKGHKFKYLKDGKFVMILATYLGDGEVVEDLTPKQLKLYWNIMNYYSRIKKITV